ncbi:MAG TPA: calcium-binding protein [Solirubrobacter sp.]|nr:calcium-binding protein [Solirubrobacter sp.]
MQPRILLPLATVALAFAAPAAANAAVTFDKQGNAVELTGDAANDNVALNVNDAGLITHNITGAPGIADNTDFDPDPNTVGTLKNDNSASFTVKTLGGNDAVNLSVPDLAGATVEGGDGDDIVVGSDSPDTLSGEAGNDRITGFRGGDTVSGGDGSDVMTWNNGDGNDTNDGGANNDETQITLAAGDDNMTVVQNGTTTRFDRLGGGAFNVQMLNGTVEKLSITSFGGNDTLATNADVTIPMAVDGGPGNDTIATGAGADLLNGFDGDDTLSGQGGGDRIVGDRGNDAMNGGAGDDTMVWNNGDNNDVMNGDDGVDRVETNLAAAGDIASLRNENGRVRFDRLNLVPFNLSISAETFELNGLGGDDSLTTAPDVAIPLDVDAGAGNDVIQGGAASDSIDGGDGNDLVQVRENVADFVRGGPGADTATVDAIDAVAGDVETVDRPVVTPPAAKPGAPKVALRANVKRRVAGVRLTCPPAASGCKGTVKLTVKVGRKNKTVGRARYSLKPGERETVRIKVAKSATKLAKKKRLVVRARVTADGAKTKTAKLTLRFK